MMKRRRREMEVTVLTKEEIAKIAEALIKDKIMNILDDLIKEAEENPEWKAVNALKCAKKEISDLKVARGGKDMTNEEAIEMIQNDMKLHHDYLSGQYRKALNMAIEAIKSTQSNAANVLNALDCVSKQAVIKAVDKHTFDTDEGLCLDEDITCILEEIPSAQLEITLESAIGYLHEIGWMQEHDRILTESAQPEIIRCKDCKYSSPNKVYGCRLERFDTWEDGERMYSDDFCSRAERRTDE